MKLLVFLMLGLVASSLAYSSGSGTCDPAFSSSMGGMERQTTASPYSFSLSSNSVDTGATVTLAVSGATYKGLIAFVNVDGGASDGSATAGVFAADTAGKFQTKDCAGSTGAITHASADDKTAESFTWTAPSTAGTYKLYAIVASGSSGITDGRTVGYWALDAVTITVNAVSTCSSSDCAACSDSTTCSTASCTWDSTASTCGAAAVCSNADCSACTTEGTCGSSTATSCTWSATTSTCSGSCTASGLIPCLGCIENDCDGTSGCEWYSEDGTGLCLAEGSGASGLQASVFVLVAAFFVGMFNM